ncbi:MAG: isoprenyl transferase [Candidatus Methylacidiphilales bacterium]
MTPRPATDREVPRHVAVIMDGNGRWAKQRNLPRIEGHREGANAARRTITEAAKAGVRFLTLYAFSVENWNRPAHEVATLMDLLIETLKRYEKDLAENDIALRAIGRLSDLPDKVRRQLDRTVERSAHHQGMTLILALSYSARIEIIEAARSLARRVAKGELKPEAIDEATFANCLYTTGIPDPDLLIRTSGEMRVSNFLLWQISYAEIHVTPTLWPDFTEKDFQQALADYAQRERRFGRV